MDYTNSELEEMDTVESRDEAYERTRETMPIDEFDEDYGTLAYDYEFYVWDS